MRDFDDLVKMYQEDPEAFEREHRQVIDRFIETLPSEDGKLRARQFQFRIDRELRPFKDPVARMNKMMELFWEGVKEFQHTLKDFQQAVDGDITIPTKTNHQEKASVIKLKRPVDPND